MADDGSKTPATLKQRVVQYIWGRDLHAEIWWMAVYFHVVRTLFVIIRDLGDGQLTLRAMSLVYTTLLSLVPVLAISFSVLKGFGVHNQIEPLLLNLVAPLGAEGAEIVATTIGFVEKMKVGVLGSVGVALLIYTVIAMMQKIERAFNDIWHVTRPRPLAQRFSDYLSVVLVGPLLIFASIGISASLTSATLFEDALQIAPIGALVKFVGLFVPFILSVAAFTFIYAFIPNTKVKLGSALMGAVTAALLWKIAGWVFATFVITSGKYAAVYSAFATLIFFMIWLYLSWLILMIGAAVAFYHQHPEYLSINREVKRLSSRVRERLALLIMQGVAQRFYSGLAPATTDSLAREIGAPMAAADTILGALEDAGILTSVAEETTAYLPAKALDTLPISTVITAIRSYGEDGYLGPDRLTASSSVDALTKESEAATDAAYAGKMVKDLLDRGTSEPAPHDGPVILADAGE